MQYRLAIDIGASSGRHIVRFGGLNGRVDVALDYFDASINRISAWVTGYRNVQKALPFGRSGTNTAAAAASPSTGRGSPRRSAMNGKLEIRQSLNRQ